MKIVEAIYFYFYYSLFKIFFFFFQFCYRCQNPQITKAQTIIYSVLQQQYMGRIRWARVGHLGLQLAQEIKRYCSRDAISSTPSPFF